MRAKSRRGLSVAAAAIVVLAAASMGCGLWQRKAAVPLSGQESSGLVAAPPSGFAFAVLNAVSMEQVEVGHEAELQAALAQVKQLGVNTVAQVMASTTTEADWAAYLNTVAGANMKAVVYFPEDPPQWDEQGFDNAAQGRFLKWAAANNPPALYAFYLVDEPFHQKHDPPFTTETLQQLYRHARQLAPNLPMLVQYSREIWKDAGEVRRSFTSGQCDICVISTLEFTTQGGVCTLDTNTLQSNHSNLRRIIKAQAPNVQIWTTAEVFGAAGGGEYCMADANGIQQMVDLLLSDPLQADGRLSGIIWQFWASPEAQRGATQDTLSDPQSGAQRDVVQAAAQRLGLPVPAP